MQWVVERERLMEQVAPKSADARHICVLDCQIVILVVETNVRCGFLLRGENAGKDDLASAEDLPLELRDDDLDRSADRLSPRERLTSTWHS